MVEHRFELLKPAEYEALKAQAPIAYLPWGAHEWHGAHNPLGVDGLKAYWLCLALADRLGGVVLPPVYCGHGTMQRHAQKCTLEFPIELVEQMARHYFLQLRLDGFKVIVAVLGHYGRDHQRAIQRMAERVEEDFAGQIRIIADADYRWTSPELPGDHGAANETSYMMHFAPESVDLARLPSVADVPTLRSRVEGVAGTDPRTEASADRGRRQVELFVARCARDVREALDSLATA